VKFHACHLPPGPRTLAAVALAPLDHVPALVPAPPAPGVVLDGLAELLTTLAQAADDHDAPTIGGPGRLVHLAELPARPERLGTLTRPMPPSVAERGPQRLWSHQVEAIDAIRAGRSVVVSTGTASGKSLCYQLPVAEAAADPIRPGTSLLLFPTKALAHDQLRALSGPGFPGVVAGAYDGDAGPEERAWIRKHATVVLTNPEMLHSGLLPHHERWATFLGRLRYVVVDELHAFRGVFGTHVAHLLRRLRRLAAHHGAHPTFVCCSATIGQPERLAGAVTGTEVLPVTDDGSPRGPRSVAVWQPPVLDEDRGTRVSAHAEAAAVTAGLVRAGHRTIGFCRSRRGTELVAADVRRRLPRRLAAKVLAYRGGYLADERRAIEDELFSGRLAGVVATSALELGVDVGGLDAVVLDGFPGTIASFWQQAGRAGRSGQASAAVLVTGADQLDQWLAAHPHELLGRPPEPAVINPANRFVLDPHLRCAAHELPLTHADGRWWPGLLDDGVRRLVQADQLAVRRRGRRSEPMAIFAGAGWPSHGVGLRCAGGPPVRIVAADDGAPVGDIDRARAPEQVHPGATYLHQGRHLRVVDLDLDEGVATVEPHDGSTTTTARTSVDIALLDIEATRPVGRATLHLGPVEVTSQVTGYQVRDVATREVVGTEALDLPPSTLQTRAFWYTVDHDLLVDAGLDRGVAPSALHAAEHAAIGMLPLFTICDRWDVGGISTLHLADSGGPTIVVYDAAPGGAGVAELGFEAADRHLEATLAAIERCRCAAGCPSCVQSPKCGNANEHLDKTAAVTLLRAILG
jgi:DEAD/DEAH box helicase domain-containing protein